MRILALLASLLAFFLFPDISVAQTRLKNLRVGVICPLTGALGAVGSSLKNSILLADRDLDTEQRVEFLFEDDGFDPGKTVSAFSKLTGPDRVDAVVAFGSGTALAVADIAERRKIPLLAMSMSEKVLEKRRYVRRFFLTAEAQVQQLENELAKRNFDTIGVVAAQQEATIQLKNLLLNRISLKVVVNEEVVPSETDQRALAARIKALNPAAVYLVLMPPQLSILGKQLRQAGYRGELFSTIQAQNKPEIVAAAGALEGMWFSTFDDSSAEGFYDRYLQSFQEEALPDGALGYDLAKLIIARPQNSELLPYLDGIGEFQGIFGNYDLSQPGTFIPATAIKVVSGERFKISYP